MKLGLPLLAAAVSAQGPGGDIEPFLAELGTYCKATYGLPAYRPHRSDTRQQWKQRWEIKKGFKSIILFFWTNFLNLESRICEFKTFSSARNKLIVSETLMSMVLEDRVFTVASLSIRK